jgi:hypothetical protein
MHNTKWFAETVLPQVAGLFDDEWEDQWWPKPMARDSRAAPRELRV